MIRVVFVAPFFSENTNLFLKGFLDLEGAQVGVLSQQPVEAVPKPLRARLAGHYQINNTLDVEQLVRGCEAFKKEWGGVDRLIGYLEQLQIPLGITRDRVGIPGMGERVARNFREKNRMKQVLRDAGVPVARQALLHGYEDARRFLDEVGYPIVVKPTAGLGSRSTMRVGDERQLFHALESLGVSADEPAQAEEFVRGDEHTFEAVSVKGERVWYSSSYYLPGPLEVLETPWLQYCVLLPRERVEPHTQAFEPHHDKALKALGMETGLTHMEWFHLKDGRMVLSEVAARPPGVRLVPMMGLAHEVDMYQKWAELLVHERFEMPERKHSVGVAFFRGQGRGHTVRAVHGIEAAQEKAGKWIVDRQLPRVGQMQASGYEGEGWAVVRCPDTKTAVSALRDLVQNVRVELG